MSAPAGLPIGLAFAFLKGSLGHLDEVLCGGGDLEDVRCARMQMDAALEAFQSSAAEREEGFLKAQLSRLGGDLVGDSHAALQVADSRLSSGVRLL